MALVPRAVRPKTVLRRTALKRSGSGGGPVWRAVAMYFIGGFAMVRNQAIFRGLLGSNRVWQAILLGVLLRGQLTKAPEPIATEALRPGQFLHISVEKPLSRRERKRSGISRRVLEQRALADVAAAKGVETAS